MTAGGIRADCALDTRWKNGAAPQLGPQVIAAPTAARTEAKTRVELQEARGIKDREHFRKAYLEPVLARGWLQRTIPDKPQSRLQRYRTAGAGMAVLKTGEGERER